MILYINHIGTLRRRLDIVPIEASLPQTTQKCIFDIFGSARFGPHAFGGFGQKSLSSLSTAPWVYKWFRRGLVPVRKLEFLARRAFRV